MTVKVLVVDDSGFFRRRVSEMLESDPQIEVIGTAENGQQAIDQVAALKPDVVTMDIEMPVMDGITAVRKIMASTPTPVIMFSSLTTDGARATLDALDAGAVDFLPKRFEDISKDREEARRTLCQRVRQLGLGGVPRPAPAPSAAPAVAPTAAPGSTTVTKPAAAPPLATRSSSSPFKLVVIGTSTGGPVALQAVLTALPADFPLPILLVQHMPESFTPAFAARLDALCKIKVRHAADGDEPQPGTAYLAPGGHQMHVEKNGGKLVIHVSDGRPDMTYKPCVDLTFGSVARVYPDSVLAVVLTGMGADGREGARMLHKGGSEIWAQDEATSVVYGMPAAVAEAGLTRKILPLSEIGPALARSV